MGNINLIICYGLLTDRNLTTICMKDKKLSRNQRKRANKKKNKLVKKTFIDKRLAVKPKSEIWFDEQMKIADLRFPFDENKIFGGLCPDYLSKHYKVIVEVDGTWHDQEYVKVQDIKKQAKYERLGYEVLRVKAYDTDSLENCLTRLKEIRLSKPLID